MKRTGQLPRPRQESDIFTSLRERPTAVVQPSIVSYLNQEEVLVPGLFSNLPMEKKKLNTYELYQQIKKREAEKKEIEEKEKARRKKHVIDEEDQPPSPKVSRALMIQQERS